MIIDFHTHTFPDSIAASTLQKLQAMGHIQAFCDGTVAGLRSSMQAAGIRHSVVLPVATNPQKVARINDLSIQMTGQAGLTYFGCIHPDTEDWHDELGRIAAAGLKGIKLHPVYQGVDINDIRYLRILDRAGSLGLIVLMHAGDDIGFPNVVRCSPEMTADALRQVGNITLVAAHMGGWRNWDRVAPLAEFPHVFIDTAFSLGTITPLEEGYYTPEQLRLLDAQTFCQLVNLFGAHRVLFGTDTPWDLQSAALARIRALPLPQDEKNAILGKNAQKLLQL